MNSRILLPLLFFPLLIPCEGQNPPRVRRVAAPEARVRQDMSPAKSAEEWIARLQEDDVRSFRSTFQQLYPELPPLEEWKKLLPPLENDERKAPQNGMRFRRQPVPETKRLFAALLEEDAATAQRISREILMRVQDSEYRREERVRVALSLSSDPNEGLEWIKENRPEFLIPRKRTNYTKPEKEPWDIALAQGRVQEGITLLWEQDNEETEWNDRLSALNQLIKLGKILPDEKLSKQAAGRITKLLQEGPQQNDRNHFYGTHRIRPWIGYQVDQGNWQALADWIPMHHKRKAERHSSSSRNELDGLELLIGLNLQDETFFLSEVKDYLQNHSLKQVLDTLDYASETGEKSLSSLTIKSLSQNGDEELAKNLALYLVARNSKKDHFYQLLLDLDKPLFEAFLLKLMVYDPFEERPLIWQAELALADDDLAKAKTLTEKAIELDPSDGDQGKETRMRAYHVLARILEKEGDQEKADFFFEVVKSIREGEAADDYLYAGLIKEATKRYREALGHFEDAYCLQSRLAMTLARAGKFEEAVPHFEKAFELMPVSFGPRESHCIGCEGIFSDERVQPIAERMLTKFIMKDPANPRAPYLLGMVLEEMKDEEGAIKAYQKALKLDPRYYNCASKLEQLLQKNPEHFADHQQLLKTLTKIAPYWQLNRQFQERSDLKQAWLDAAQVRPSPLELPELPVKKDALNVQFGHSFSSSSQAARTDALDGWSRSELLRGNELLDSIDDL